MNTTIFETNAGIKITNTAEGWKTQNWWKGDTEWRLLNDTNKEALVDLTKTEVIGMSIDDTIEFRKVLGEVISKRLKMMEEVQTTVETAAARGEIPRLTDEQTQVGLKNMKDAILKEENVVEVTNVDDTIAKMGEAEAICLVFGIKIVHETFGETGMENIAMALKMHGHVTFELHFPDGDKFETVMRYRDDNIRSYTYKL